MREGVDALQEKGRFREERLEGREVQDDGVGLDLAESGLSVRSSDSWLVMAAFASRPAEAWRRPGGQVGPSARAVATGPARRDAAPTARRVQVDEIVEGPEERDEERRAAREEGPFVRLDGASMSASS